VTRRVNVSGYRQTPDTEYFAATTASTSLFAKYDGLLSPRHTSYSGRAAAPRACNLSRADRSIDSPCRTYESPVRVLEQFYAGWKKDAAAIPEEEGAEKGRTAEAAATDTRECRRSCCTPAGGWRDGGGRVGESREVFRVMHRESRLHALNEKRGKITLSFRRLDSAASARVRVRACVYVTHTAIYSCLLSKLTGATSSGFQQSASAVYLVYASFYPW